MSSSSKDGLSRSGTLRKGSRSLKRRTSSFKGKGIQHPEANVPAGRDPQDEKVEQFLKLLMTGEPDVIRQKLLLAPFMVHTASSESGSAPVHIAARRGDVDILRQILRCQPKLDIVNQRTNTPLMEATKCSNYACIKLLNERKADLFVPDAMNQTPFSVFLAKQPTAGEEELYKEVLFDFLARLVEMVPPPVAPDSATSPRRTVANERTKLHDLEGLLPIHVAAKHANEVALATLLEPNALFATHAALFDVDAVSLRGATALMAAVEAGSYDCSFLLLKHNANPFFRNPGGMSPYDAAIKTKQREVINLMNEIKHANREGCKPAWVVETSTADWHIQLNALRSRPSDQHGLMDFFKGLDLMAEFVTVTPGQQSKGKHAVKRIKTAVTEIMTDLIANARRASWCAEAGVAGGGEQKRGMINWAWVFHQRLLVSEKCLTQQALEVYSCVMQTYVNNAKESDEKTAAEEFLHYLATHEGDPDNSLIGLVPSAILLEPYAGTLKNMYKALDYCGVSMLLPNHKSNSLVSTQAKPEPLEFTDAVLSNRSTIYDILQRWCQRDSMELNKRDIMGGRASGRMNALLDGSRCQALFTLLQAENAVCDIWGHTVLQPGELVILLDHASKRKKGGEQQYAFCFARYAGYTDGKKISVYAIPEEIVATEVDLSLVIPFPDSMKTYLGSEEMHKLVENPVEKFIRESDALVNGAVARLMKSMGIDKELMETARSVGSDLDMTSFSQLKVAEARLDLICKTLTETEEFVSTMAEYQVRLKRFNAYLRGYGLFPPVRRLAMMLLEHVEPEKTLAAEVQTLYERCSKATTYLEDQQLLIFQGEKKKEMAQWWQGLLKGEAAAYLRDLNYDFKTVPDDYMSAPPKSMAAVQSNLTLLKEILNYEHGLEELIRRVTGMVYPIIDRYITNSFAAIETKVGLPDGSIKSLEEAETAVTEHSFADQKLASWLLDVVQDAKLLVLLKQDDTDQVVPISKQVVQYFSHQKEKMETVITAWEVKVHAGKHRKGGKKTQKELEKFLKNAKVFTKQALAADADYLTNPQYLTKLIAIAKGPDPVLRQKAIHFIAVFTFPEEKVVGMIDLLRRNRLLHSILEGALRGDFRTFRAVKQESYKVTKMVGKGSGGKIFKARRGNTIYALKQCSEDGMVYTSMEEFLAEVTIMSVFDHPHVIKCHGASDDPANLFFVMTMCPFDLEYLLRPLSGEPVALSWSLRMRMCLQVAQALKYVHSWGLLHRDMKTSNVLIDDEFNCYLTDFGISAAVSNVDPSRRLTLNMGTPAWMAPEVLEGDGTYGLPVDVYSLGVVFWEIITGKRPYAEISSFEVPGYILSGERLAIPEECSPQLADLLTCCWASVPEERPTATEVVNMMEKIYMDELGDASEPELPARLPKKRKFETEMGQVALMAPTRKEAAKELALSTDQLPALRLDSSEVPAAGPAPSPEVSVLMSPRAITIPTDDGVDSGFRPSSGLYPRSEVEDIAPFDTPKEKHVADDAAGKVEGKAEKKEPEEEKAYSVKEETEEKKEEMEEEVEEERKVDGEGKVEAIEKKVEESREEEEVMEEKEEEEAKEEEEDRKEEAVEREAEREVTEDVSEETRAIQVVELTDASVPKEEALVKISQLPEVEKTEEPEEKEVEMEEDTTVEPAAELTDVPVVEEPRVNPLLLSGVDGDDVLSLLEQEELELAQLELEQEQLELELKQVELLQLEREEEQRREAEAAALRQAAKEAAATSSPAVQQKNEEASEESEGGEERGTGNDSGSPLASSGKVITICSSKMKIVRRLKVSSDSAPSSPTEETEDAQEDTKGAAEP